MIGLVNESNFVIAVRDTGYRSPAHALAEFIDNSIDANASTVSITFGREDDGPSIHILDDGSGMHHSTMPTALQFGGTSRFGSRSGLGRFGMGLPSSALSLGRRVELFSWTKREAVYGAVLDVDEFNSARHPRIKDAKLLTNPPFRAATSTGTMVVIRKADRLPVQDIHSRVECIAFELRRIFRWYIAKGLRIVFQGKLLKPFDPLFLSGSIKGVTATQYGPSLRYRLRADGNPRGSEVEIRFSMLPIQHWRVLTNIEKQREGISKGAGVSIVRGNREIAYGWYFLGSKRRENYDDWWRCEVCFPPSLDDLFRVSHTKQQIAPAPALAELLTRDIENIARILNSRVRREFVRLANRKPRPSETGAASQDKYLPPLISHDSTSLREVNYRIEVNREEGDNAFYTCGLEEGTVAIQLNERHPFAAEYKRLRYREAESSRPIEELLLAAARVELGAASKREQWWYRRFRTRWSDVLATFMGPRT
jgi:hypothetical protein